MMNIFDASDKLRHYMTYNFYPPIRVEVIDSYVEHFVKYWNGEITLKDMCKTVPIGEEMFTDRYSFFFKPEDLE